MALPRRFLASQRATVERTTAMVRRLCERHGEPVGDGTAYRTPPPERIARLGEDALEDCGFEYRAAYLAETTGRFRSIFLPHHGYAQTSLYHDAANR